MAADRGIADVILDGVREAFATHPSEDEAREALRRAYFRQNGNRLAPMAYEAGWDLIEMAIATVRDEVTS